MCVNPVIGKEEEEEERQIKSSYGYRLVIDFQPKKGIMGTSIMSIGIMGTTIKVVKQH